MSSMGLNKVGDLYDEAGILVFNMEPLRSLLSPSNIYLLISMLDAMPPVWQNLLNSSKSSIAHLTTPFEPNSYMKMTQSPLKNLSRSHSIVSFRATLSTKLR